MLELKLGIWKSKLNAVLLALLQVDFLDPLGLKFSTISSHVIRGWEIGNLIKI